MTLRKALFVVFAGCLLLASQQAVTADSAHSLSRADRTFIDQVSVGNLAEIHTGRLAMLRSKNPQILNIAGKMIEDHTKAQDELQSLARRFGVALPTTLDAPHQQMYQRLARLSGGLFEESYLRSQAADHFTMISLFQKQMTQRTNPHVQGYAARYLPKIQNHAAMISRTADAMGIIVPRPSKVALASDLFAPMPPRG
jgi:putative membrane protein